MNRIAYGFVSLFLLTVAGCAGLQPRPIFTTSKPPSPEKQAGKKTPAVSSESPVTVISGKEDRSSPDFWREKLMQEIEDLLGTPYRYGGSSPREGMDCSGLVYYVFRNALNLKLPRNVDSLWRYGLPVPESDLQFGDLVFFRLGRMGKIDHVGIYLGSGQFVHASRSAGVEISRLNSSFYRDHLAGVRRVLQ